MAVKVSSKYQVVIPEKVRSAIGLQPGTQVDIIAKGGVAYIVPVPSLSEIKSRLQGKLTNRAVRDKKDRKLKKSES